MRTFRVKMYAAAHACFSVHSGILMNMSGIMWCPEFGKTLRIRKAIPHLLIFSMIDHYFTHKIMMSKLLHTQTEFAKQYKAR